MNGPRFIDTNIRYCVGTHSAQQSAGRQIMCDTL
jgi:hypothetical protein